MIGSTSRTVIPKTLGNPHKNSSILAWPSQSPTANMKWIEQESDDQWSFGAYVYLAWMPSGTTQPSTVYNCWSLAILCFVHPGLYTMWTLKHQFINTAPPPTMTSDSGGSGHLRDKLLFFNAPFPRLKSFVSSKYAITFCKSLSVWRSSSDKLNFPTAGRFFRSVPEML